MWNRMRCPVLARSKGVDGVAEFRLADAESGIPYRDNYFDAVITECVVNLIPNKQRAVDEIARVLKPGGKILLISIAAIWPPALATCQPIVPTARHRAP